MSQISVNHLTFSYEGSFDEIFTDVSFTIDTDWKLGFIGRNGKGKTTFLKLLLGELEYRGSIVSSEDFEYFPFPVKQEERNTLELVDEWNASYEFWELCRELNYLNVDAEVLYRPFSTLSQGERTKVMLAALFLKEHAFLLIDEPTNHLDGEARKTIGNYLNRKKGFILVSHDRQFLDTCIDHVLALNRNDIQVIQGNFSSWWREKQRRDEGERQENRKLEREIGRLKEAARRTEDWSAEVEKSKHGQRVAGLRPDRGHIGRMAAKMMKRAKVTENRVEQTIEDKEKLLKNVERQEALKLFPLTHHKEELVHMEGVTLEYGNSDRKQPLSMRPAAPDREEQPKSVESCSGNESPSRETEVESALKQRKAAVRNFSLSIRQGERIALKGPNGCGKSTVIRAILEKAGVHELWMDDADQRGGKLRMTDGIFTAASGLSISYVPQDASFLNGNLEEFAAANDIDLTIFKSLLRKLDFSREQFEKRMEEFSAGQKKKVLLAKSLCQRAHLYIWDEPMNYIDIFSRMQLEELIMAGNLTMLYVEHDAAFVSNTATQVIEMKG